MVANKGIKRLENRWVCIPLWYWNTTNRLIPVKGSKEGSTRSFFFFFAGSLSNTVLLLYKEDDRRAFYYLTMRGCKYSFTDLLHCFKLCKCVFIQIYSVWYITVGIFPPMIKHCRFPGVAHIFHYRPIFSTYIILRPNSVYNVVGLSMCRGFCTFSAGLASVSMSCDRHHMTAGFYAECSDPAQHCLNLLSCHFCVCEISCSELQHVHMHRNSICIVLGHPLHKTNREVWTGFPPPPV